MKHLRVVLAMLAVVLAAACYPPVTTHPVGTTAGLRNDPALFGLWKSIPDKGEKAAIFTFTRGKGETMNVHIDQGKDTKPGDATDVVVTTARVGSSSFINARLVAAKPEDQTPAGTSIPILYRIDAKSQLTLSWLNEKATKAAIRAHKLKGDAGKTDTSDATITEEPRVLDAFLSSPGGLALFEKPFATLRR